MSRFLIVAVLSGVGGAVAGYSLAPRGGRYTFAVARSESTAALWRADTSTGAVWLCYIREGNQKGCLPVTGGVDDPLEILAPEK